MENLFSVIDELRIKQDWNAIPLQVKKLWKKQSHGNLSPADEIENDRLTAISLEASLEAILSKHFATMKPDTKPQILGLENNRWDIAIPFSWKTLQSSSASIVGNSELKAFANFVSTDLTIPLDKISVAHNMAILARLYFSLGKYDECWSVLDRIHLKDCDPAEFLKMVGYERVLGIQILCLKIISTAVRNSFVDKIAADLLCMVLIEHKLLEDHLLKQNWWHTWVEEAAYRVFFFHLQDQRPLDAIKMARCYLEYTSLLPLTFEPLKKISLLRAYLHVLIQNCRPNTYEAPQPIFTKKAQHSILSFHDELGILLSMYEFLVSSYISFPRAGQKPRVSERMYDEITFIYGLLAPFEDPAKAFMYSASDDKYQLKVETNKASGAEPIVTASQALVPENPLNRQTPWTLYLDAMYRATKLTFRSKTLLKRIGMAAYCLQSIDEANLAFKTYLEDRKESKSEWWMQAPAYPCENGVYLDTESAFDVLNVHIVACRLCLDANQTQLAYNHIDKALEISKQFRKECAPMDPLIQYYMSAALWKLGIQEHSMTYLKEAARLDPHNWKVHYSLALQNAELGHMKLAAEHIKTALKLNPSHVDCWHLFSLLSLVSTDNESQLAAVEKALKICSMADQAIQGGRKVKLSKSKKNVRVEHHYSDEWINFLLTKVLLEETLYYYNLLNNTPFGASDGHPPPGYSGAPDILEAYRDIFEIYIRTFFPKVHHDASEPTPTKATNTPMFSATEQEFCNILPLPHVLVDLNSRRHPPIPSFYPNTSLSADSSGFSFSNSASSNSVSGNTEPMNYSWFMRKRKQRYMEIWAQVAQLFRRAGKYHDARVACLEAQKVERGNVDIEFELGLVALFQPVKADDCQNSVNAETCNESTDNIPSNLFLVEDYDEPFPDVFNNNNNAPLSPVLSQHTERDLASTGLKGNIEAAMMHFRSALTYDEEHVHARTWLGRCYYLCSNFEQARANLERAVSDGKARGAKVWNS